MTEPSKAAIQYACDLANAAGNCDGWKPESVGSAWPPMLALALRLDFEDRVARELDKELNGYGHSAGMPIRAKLVRSLMLPDPPDPDEELAREKIMAIWSNGTPDRERVIAVFAEALREQGRLTDAK